ncbi:hypothetical protein V8F20_002512 [Naviculisporaceae sp. PSN 640]
MSALPSNRVYQGFWIDHSQGPVTGATITTTGDKANLVIAVLSLLVAFSGAHLWDLIAFVGYCAGTSKGTQPAFHHQRQLLARNLTSPGSFVLETLKVGWAWRKHRPWSCLALMTVLALFCSVGFMAAGIFVSSLVSSEGIQVLVQSPTCGLVSWRNESTPMQREYQQLLLNQASIYSEACYNKTGRLPQCNIFSQPAIPIVTVTEVECPFADGLCKTPSALRLGTGLLDSDSTFGINAPSAARVQMERIVTCAPIDGTGFYSSRPIPTEVVRRYENRDPFKDEYVFEWFMGLITAEDRPYNSTFFMSNYTPKVSTGYDLTPRAFYAPLGTKEFKPWHQSTFTPLLGLFRNSTYPRGDVHILAVQNDGVKFWAPSDDPIFAAHREMHVFFDDNSNLTMYRGDNPASFLGCVEQFKFCFSSPQPGASPWCTDLLGLDQAYLQAIQQSRLMRIPPEQNATLNHLFMLIPSWYWLTRTPMQVTKNSASFQLGVPNNQWQVEMFAWMDYLLAISQSSITHIAAGPGIVDEKFNVLSLKRLGDEEQALCHSQRMGAPDGYSNINFVGFILVVSVSVVIMGVNMTLVPLLKYCHRASGGRLFPRVKMWAEEGMLQIQRKAYEGMGYDNWLRGTSVEAPEGGWDGMKSVPVYDGDCRGGVMLPGLYDHPREPS